MGELVMFVWMLIERTNDVNTLSLSLWLLPLVEVNALQAMSGCMKCLIKSLMIHERIRQHADDNSPEQQCPVEGEISNPGEGLCPLKQYVNFIPSCGELVNKLEVLLTEGC